MTPNEKELVQGLYDIAYDFARATHEGTVLWKKHQETLQGTRVLLALDLAPTEGK